MNVLPKLMIWVRSTEIRTDAEGGPLEHARFDQAAYLRLIRDETRGPVATLARCGLKLASFGYTLGVAGRELAFRRGWKPSFAAGIPVVSVGNITLGGTGKTPMVEAIARWYRRREVRVAILSRGYGSTSGLNDEGRVLEETLPDVPHLQGVDRVVLAKTAVEELEAQLIVLDDGFQHRRLRRDLDIVLIDALDPFGGGQLMPRGLLREPVKSLRRASLVVLSRSDLVTEGRRQEIRAQAEHLAGPLSWVSVRHAPLDLVDVHTRSVPLGYLGGKKIAAFCGIGNPEGFRRTIAPMGEVLDLRVFPDHHGYTAADVTELGQWAKRLGSDLVLTTQKDFVKLRVERLGGVPLYVLRIGLQILDGEPLLDEALAQHLPAPGKEVS